MTDTRPVEPNILGVIPARGGSRGIPRKNLHPVAGRPLVAWSIDAARESRRLARFVVSTEDREIADVAGSLGASVLWRPPALAADDIGTLEVVRHALTALTADVVVVLQPTSPVRGFGLVDAAVETFLAAGADSLGTVHRDFTYEYGNDMPRRQDMTPRLVDNGSVYVIAASLVRAGRWLGDRLATLAVSREEGIDVDEEFDLWLAEQILLHRPRVRWPSGRAAGREEG
jgi:CMP-N,N'-diacetyllegionaminic acid synthase